MSLFHKHKWVETQNEFFPPQVQVKTMEGYFTDDMKRLIFGYTVVTRVCDCGQISVQRFVGNIKTGKRND